MDSNLSNSLAESKEVKNQTESTTNSTLNDSNSSVEGKDAANIMESTINLNALVSMTLLHSSVDDKGAPQLTEGTIDAIINSYEVVFIFFYAQGCQFSTSMVPIFDKVVDEIMSEFPRAGQIAIGKVDCDKEKVLAERFSIGCYPQFKFIRNGQLSKRNYDDNRTVESFVDNIKKEMEDPIKEFKDNCDLLELDPKKRLYIGYFKSKETLEYNIFRKVASNFKHYCQFRASFGEAVAKMSPSGQPGLVLRPDITLTEKDEIFNGSLLNYNEVNEWMAENYVPLVRKTSITFDNIRDFLLEELPRLILFHKPDDKESVNRYTEFCESTFMHLKNKLLILTSGDIKYAYRLRRFRKDESHLPLIGYEMTDFNFFLFGNIQDMEVPGKFEQFVNDLVFNTPRDSGEAPNVTEETLNLVKASNEVVFLLFYHSNSVGNKFEEIPKFNEVAKKIKTEFSLEGKIFLGKVDMQKDKCLSNRFAVRSFPKFVLIRDGQRMKKSFKGERTIEKLVEFVKKELEDPLEEFRDLNDLGTLDPKKRLFIGYFDSKDTPEYDIFRRVASIYKNECQFRVEFGDVAKMHPSREPRIVLRTDITLSIEVDETFNGSLLNYSEVREWISDNYVPLVRKTSITFDNQDDFYDEELPMLILFHETGDKELVERYTQVCESTLMHFKRKLVILTSDDEHYASFLHYRKPIIPFIGFSNEDGFSTEFCAIQDMEVHGKLECFVNDNIDNGCFF